MLDLGALGEFLRDALEGDGAGEAFGVEVLVGILERGKGFGAEVLGMTADRNGVETAHHEVFDAHGEHVGRCVLAELGAATDHGKGPDVGELQQAGGAADNGVVFHNAFAGDLDAIGHNDVVAEDATVCDVAVGHDEAVAADDGLGAIHRAEVDGDAFAENGAVADFDVGDITGLPLEVLGLHTHAGLREDFAVFTNGGVPLDRAVVMHLGATANLDVRPDISKGTDLGLGMNLRTFANVCKRMNSHGTNPLLVFLNEMNRRTETEDHRNPHQQPRIRGCLVGQRL